MKKIFRPITLIFKELKQVEWISLKQTIQYTVLVLVISIFIAIITIAFDTIFYKARSIITSV